MILDDGSKDQTASILSGLQDELPQLLVIKKANSGHGATIRMGYALALEHVRIMFSRPIRMPDGAGEFSASGANASISQP
jgi:glycosyltransferase involved in cell wall biosynthesis